MQLPVSFIHTQLGLPSCRIAAGQDSLPFSGSVEDAASSVTLPTPLLVLALLLLVMLLVLPPPTTTAPASVLMGGGVTVRPPGTPGNDKSPGSSAPAAGVAAGSFEEDIFVVAPLKAPGPRVKKPPGDGPSPGLIEPASCCSSGCNQPCRLPSCCCCTAADPICPVLLLLPSPSSVSLSSVLSRSCSLLPPCCAGAESSSLLLRRSSRFFTPAQHSTRQKSQHMT